MATVADTLVTKHVLDNKQYMVGAKEMIAATGGIGVSIAGLLNPATAVQTALSLVAGAYIAVSVAAAAATAATVAYGAYAAKEAASFDALRKALQTYAGTAEETEEQIKRLKVVAQAPGLGFREAVQGSVRLQSIGFTARGAERALKALGNALASSGGGKAELDGIVMALSQIVGKGVVSAEEINQIAERFPGIRRVMINEFGTASAEIIQKTTGPEGFITGLINGLEKLPQSTGSAQTMFENFQDALDQLNIAVGTFVLSGLAKEFEVIASYIGYVAQSGVMERIVGNFMSIIGLGGGGEGSTLVSAADKFLTLMEMASSVLKDGVATAKNFLIDLFKKFANIPFIGDYAKAAINGIEAVGVISQTGAFGTGGMNGFARFQEEQKKKAKEDEAAAKADKLLKDQQDNQKATADNTKKMVELQQKAIDLQTTLLGGGAFTKQGFSQVNLSRIIGGSQMERGIRMAVVGMVNGIGDFGVQQNRMGY